jgi:hypothetical protein
MPAIEPRKLKSGCRRCFECGRQHDRRIIASAQTARRGRRTWHVRKLVAREPGDPTSDQAQQTALVRIGGEEP